MPSYIEYGKLMLDKMRVIKDSFDTTQNAPNGCNIVDGLTREINLFGWHTSTHMESFQTPSHSSHVFSYMHILESSSATVWHELSMDSKNLDVLTLRMSEKKLHVIVGKVLRDSYLIHNALVNLFDKMLRWLQSSTKTLLQDIIYENLRESLQGSALFTGDGAQHLNSACEVLTRFIVALLEKFDIVFKEASRIYPEWRPNLVPSYTDYIEHLERAKIEDILTTHVKSLDIQEGSKVYPPVLIAMTENAFVALGRALMSVREVEIEFKATLRALLGYLFPDLPQFQMRDSLRSNACLQALSMNYSLFLLALDKSDELMNFSALAEDEWQSAIERTSERLSRNLVLRQLTLQEFSQLFGYGTILGPAEHMNCGVIFLNRDNDPTAQVVDMYATGATRPGYLADPMQKLTESSGALLSAYMSKINSSAISQLMINYLAGTVDGRYEEIKDNANDSGVGSLVRTYPDTKLWRLGFGPDALHYLAAAKCTVWIGITDGVPTRLYAVQTQRRHVTPFRADVALDTLLTADAATALLYSMPYSGDRVTYIPPKRSLLIGQQTIPKDKLTSVIGAKPEQIGSNPWTWLNTLQLVIQPAPGSTLAEVELSDKQSLAWLAGVVEDVYVPRSIYGMANTLIMKLFKHVVSHVEEDVALMPNSLAVKKMFGLQIASLLLDAYDGPLAVGWAQNSLQRLVSVNSHIRDLARPIDQVLTRVEIHCRIREWVINHMLCKLGLFGYDEVPWYLTLLHRFEVFDILLQNRPVIRGRKGMTRAAIGV